MENTELKPRPVFGANMGNAPFGSDYDDNEAPDMDDYMPKKTKCPDDREARFIMLGRAGRLMFESVDADIFFSIEKFKSDLEGGFYKHVVYFNDKDKKVPICEIHDETELHLNPKFEYQEMKDGQQYSGRRWAENVVQTLNSLVTESMVKRVDMVFETAGETYNGLNLRTITCTSMLCEQLCTFKMYSLGRDTYISRKPLKAGKPHG